MGFVKNCVALLIVAALLAPVVSAGGFEISAVGTKARGMSGAFRAVADDWTAAYYNPAGYAQIYDNQLGANFAFLHYRNEINPDYNYDGYEVGFYNGQDNFNKHEILSNPSAGIMFRLPIWGETVFGFSGYQLFDQNITWTLMELPQAYNNLTSLPRDQFRNNLDVVAFQLTIAREFIEEKLSIGLGLQLLRADLIYSNVYIHDNPLPEPLGARPWDKVFEYNKNDGSGYGFGLNFGVKYSASEKFDVGLNARLPFAIDLEGDARIEFYMPYIENPANTGTIESPTSPGTVGNLFVAGNTIRDSAQFAAELKLPASFGIGLAYQVSEKLQVALDAEYTLWSKFEGFEFAFSDHNGFTGAADTSAFINAFFTQDLSAPIEWDDAAKVMFGFNYDLNDKLTLLGGAGFDQSPSTTNMYFTPQFMDIGEKMIFSGGFIYKYRNWDFSFATSYSGYSDEEITDLVDLNDDGLFDNFNGTFRAGTYETVLAFNYRF